MQPAKRRRRTRYTCPFCRQSLVYTAYQRHLDLPNIIYCPVYSNDGTSSESDSTFYHSDGDQIDDLIQCEDMKMVRTSDDISLDTSRSSTSCESGPEIWDDLDPSSSDSEYTGIDETLPIQVNHIVCTFLSFFQLCFRISDRAIALLLSFLSSLFHIFLLKSSDSTFLKKFIDRFPKTLYSLRKPLQMKVKNSYIQYVACPRCHKLYDESKCIVRTLNKDVSLKCNYIKFPNHPHQTRRKKCDAELMKTVKIGKGYKLTPRKTYVYYNIIESIQRLLLLPDFFNWCEQWRNRKVPNGWLADVYDGKIWKEWMEIDGVPYLGVPGNLLLMLNIDWFQPFQHTQYSVGVIYLVIQNLPRHN